MPRLAYQTELGRGWVEYDGDRVVSISLPDAGAFADDEPGPAPPRVVWLRDGLEAYYRGAADFVPGCRLVDSAGSTDFTRAIYGFVGGLKPGETVTYGEVAASLGHPGAARAVGAAMARNPFPPVIPCHRVVGADGNLRGYAGGLDMKARLLRMEGARD